MIVWSGWGFLVAIFAVIGFFIGIPVSGLISQDSNIASAIAIILAGLVAGLGSFLLARQIEKGEGRAYIDEATQQRIVVRPSAGSLFFVPTRYWAYIAPVAGIALGAFMMMSPASPDAPSSAAATAAATAPVQAS